MSTTFNNFDQVRLLTTKHIKYISAPPGTELSPHGIWVVASTIGGDLLVTKGEIVVRVPSADVLKMGSYDLTRLYNQLGSLSRGQNKTGK